MMNIIRKIFGLHKNDNEGNAYTIHENDDEVEYQGDYAKANFISGFVDNAIPLSWHFSLYFESEFGIHDTLKYYKEMIREGYLQQASFAQKLNTLKVTELKQILKDNDLHLTGKKKDLIERIANNLPENKFG